MHVHYKRNRRARLCLPEQIRTPLPLPFHLGDFWVNAGLLRDLIGFFLNLYVSKLPEWAIPPKGWARGWPVFLMICFKEVSTFRLRLGEGMKDWEWSNSLEKVPRWVHRFFADFNPIFLKILNLSFLLLLLSGITKYCFFELLNVLELLPE